MSIVDVNDLVNKTIQREVDKMQTERDEAMVHLGNALSENRLLRGELAGYKLAFNACSFFPRIMAKLLGNLGSLARLRRTGTFCK